MDTAEFVCALGLIKQGYLSMMCHSQMVPALLTNLCLDMWMVVECLFLFIFFHSDIDNQSVQLELHMSHVDPFAIGYSHWLLTLGFTTG